MYYGKRCRYLNRVVTDLLEVVVFDSNIKWLLRIVVATTEVNAVPG